MVGLVGFVVVVVVVVAVQERLQQLCATCGRTLAAVVALGGGRAPGSMRCAQQVSFAAVNAV